MARDISGGFIVKGAKNLDAAYKRIPEWVESSYLSGRQFTQQAIVNLATELYDQYKCLGDKSLTDMGETAYDAAYTWIQGELKEGNPNYSLGTAIAIGVARDKRVIGILQSDFNGMREHFMSQPGIEPYWYSEVTGKPRKMTPKQWEQRRLDWESMEINDKYVQLLEYTLIPPNVMFIPSRDDNANIPSFESRLHKLATKHTMDECRHEFGLYSDRQYVEFMMHNPIYSERLKASLQFIERQLDQNLTLEKLQEDV